MSHMLPPKDEKLSEEQQEAASDQYDFFEKQATEMTYQLSNGRKRQIAVPYNDSDLYAATMGVYGPFEEGGDEDAEKEIMVLKLEGGYQTAFIRPSELDYMIVPAHKWRKGMDEVSAGIPADDDDDEE